MYNNPHLFGDLYVNVFVEMPDKLTDEQVELIQKMKKISNENES